MESHSTQSSNEHKETTPNATGESPCKANLTFLEAEDRALSGNVQEKATSEVKIHPGLTQPPQEGRRSQQRHTRELKTPKLPSNAPKPVEVRLAESIRH